ncbi:hypothetical protein C8J57DRAFT_1212786 [Mycena rebaudengoi]|nr:hypothetical protein C8J57DRAFT_1212786 [Mycena rebaudengoi]
MQAYMFYTRFPADSRRLKLLVAFVCLVLASYGFSMVSLPDYDARFHGLLVAGWAFSAANDITIAVSLVYIFYTARIAAERSTLILMRDRTVALLDKLIKWTIETGVLTRFLLVSDDEGQLHLALCDDCGDKTCTEAFSNSLFASLNSRAILRAMDNATVTLLVSGPDLSGTNPLRDV